MIASRHIAFDNTPEKGDCLCFTAEDAGSTIKMVKQGVAPEVYLETSPTGDDGSWSEFIVHTSSTSTDGTTITLDNVGDKVYFRATDNGNKTFSNNTSSNTFVMQGRISASGSIQSLLNRHGYIIPYESPYTFKSLFYECTSLISAPELNATHISKSCYHQMFYNCTSLRQAPSILPATKLYSSCYNCMFFGCSSLINAPEIPATTLAETCCRYMFYGCSSLTIIPKILPATELVASCYYGMFDSCKSITHSPFLPATTLVDQCYYKMFSSCSSLINIKTNQLSFEGCGIWVKGVSSSGTFICGSALGTNDTIIRGVSACPNGWSVVNEV